MFQVGEKVYITCESPHEPYLDKYISTHGTVVEVDTRMATPRYYVECYDGDRWWFFPEVLTNVSCELLSPGNLTELFSIERRVNDEVS